MAKAIKGAEILRVHEGPYTNQIVYRRQCDSCGYSDSNSAPIVVTCLPYDTVMHGVGHSNSFECKFCGSLQDVVLEG